MGGATRRVRNMFLNILPPDLKTKILEYPCELATGVLKRALVLKKEALAEVTRKVLAKEAGGKVHALSERSSEPAESPIKEEIPPPPVAPDCPE